MPIRSRETQSDQLPQVEFGLQNTQVELNCFIPLLHARNGFVSTVLDKQGAKWMMTMFERNETIRVVMCSRWEGNDARSKKMKGTRKKTQSL